MDLLHVITGLNVGGAETMLSRLIERRLVTPEIRPQVASLMPPGAAGARIVRAGVPVHDLGMRGLGSACLAAARLTRLIRVRRPDCILAWMHHAQLAASLAVAAARTHTPVVWNVRHSLGGYDREKATTRAVLRVQARLSGLPAAICYNAHDASRQYRRFGFRNARQMVIPNGFEPAAAIPRAEAAARVRATFGIAPEPLLIGMVARAHPMKDVPNLTAALAQAVASGLDAHLLLVGEGMDRPSPAVAAGLAALPAGRWTLCGQRSDVDAWLGGLDLLMLPSAWGEGFPNIVGEAMRAGVPCIVTDVGDAGWVVGEAGRVVPPRDAGALAAAILDLAALGADGRARMGWAGRSRIRADFDLDDIVRRYADLLHGVVRAAAAPEGVAALRESLS